MRGDRERHGDSSRVTDTDTEESMSCGILGLMSANKVGEERRLPCKVSQRASTSFQKSSGNLALLLTE